MKNNNRHLIKAVFAPVLFEMCGIIPLVLVALGFLSAGTGIALRNTLVYQYTIVFFVLAFGFFIYSVYSYLKEQNSCNITGLSKHRLPITYSMIILIIIEAVLLVMLQVTEGMVYGQSQIQILDFAGIGAFLVTSLSLFFIATKIINK